MKKFFKILLVDDDDVDNYLNKYVIDEMGIAERVSICKNGSEALSLLKETCLCKEDGSTTVCPELILLDINMPNMNGFEFLKELQNINDRSFSIVILSSSDLIQDVEEAAKFKVNYYIAKPLTIDKLRKMVERVL
jgi:CheY-like chemotaxis protein